MANRVLIFEDNPISSKMMKTFLEQLGYYVELAFSLAELDSKLKLGFDIMFVDVSSPSIDAESLTDFVRKSKQTVQKCPPIVAVMNTVKEAELKHCLQIGMDGYITKPISVKSLRETIDRVRSGKVPPAPGEDVIDLDKATANLGISDKKLLVGLFEKFFENAAKDVEQMVACAVARDYTTLRALTHSIKVAARNLRFTNLGKLAEEIEGQTKYPSVNVDIPQMVSNFRGAFNRVYNDFRSKYPKE